MKNLPNLLLAFAALLVAGCASVPSTAPAEPPLRIAITMDDLPVHGPMPPGATPQSVARQVVKALRDAGVGEAYGFANAAPLERDPSLSEVLTIWTAAGYPLANHGWAHRSYNELTLAEFEAEVERNEPALRQYGGAHDWRWFRFPFGAEREGDRRAAAFDALARRGYRIAGVTTDYSDWQWNDAYMRCRAARDEEGIAALERAYLDAVRESVDRSRRMSRDIYGRDIPYVLLTHVGAFTAHMLPRTLELYRELGFHFVSLSDAYADPAYREPAAGAPAHASLEERAQRRGLPVPPREDRSAIIAAACR